MEKNTKFRFQAHRAFLTYSQCNVSKSEIKSHLETRGELKYYSIAQEVHQDGGLHIHALVHYIKKIDTTNPRYFDYLEFHPNVKRVETNTDWDNKVRYNNKYDKEPLVQLKETNKQQQNKELYERLMTQGPDNMLRNGEINVYRYPTLKRTYQEHLAALKEEELKPDADAFIDTPWGFKIEVDIDKKKCHYWLYSHEPNQGKTTFGEMLTEKYRAAFYHYSEIFQNQIIPQTEILILDEYRGQLKISELNQICDGKKYFSHKGKPNFMLNTKPMVIVLSNRTIQEIYKNAQDVSLVYARFTEINTILLNIECKIGGTGGYGGDTAIN